MSKSGLPSFRALVDQMGQTEVGKMATGPGVVVVGMAPHLPRQILRRLAWIDWCVFWSRVVGRDPYLP